MSCSIEKLPCDHCGQEVERYEIRVVKNDEGEREWVCAECAGETARVTAPSIPNCA